MKAILRTTNGSKPGTRATHSKRWKTDGSAVLVELGLTEVCSRVMKGGSIQTLAINGRGDPVIINQHCAARVHLGHALSELTRAVTKGLSAGDARGLVKFIDRIRSYLPVQIPHRNILSR